MPNSTQSVTGAFPTRRLSKDWGRLALLAALAGLLWGAVDSPSHAQTVALNYGRIPLSFQPNKGQMASEVQFYSQGPGYALSLGGSQMVLQLQRQQAHAGGSQPPEIDTLKMQLLGANPTPAAVGVDRLQGTVNYFIGNDPARWHTNIPTFGKVNVAAVYPGIDLAFYGNQRQLEYDFIVDKQADPSRIAWAIDGAELHLDKDGSLEMKAPGGPARFLAPVAYQMIDGKRCPVAVKYMLAGNTVRFQLGTYDPREKLVIDPIVSYFSYLGGSGNDWIGNPYVGSTGPDATQGAGIDSAGDFYVAGSTTSTDFPVQSPASTQTTKGSGQIWAFVSKFSPDGTTLLYSTYLGGSTGGNDSAYAIAVDAAGDAYVTGEAGTSDFPTTAGAFQTVCAPEYDSNTGKEASTCAANSQNSQNAFVLKLNPSGSSLVYSSFLGGMGGAWGMGIAVDSAGQAYVTGTEQASLCGGPAYEYNVPYVCFPTTSTAVISDIGGGNPLDMAFLSVFNNTGSALVYSTLFGDTQGGVSVKGAGCTADCGVLTHGTAVALDPAGDVYIGGFTSSANLLLTKGAFNTTGGGPNTSNPISLNGAYGSGYVAKFAPVTSKGTSLLYSTYFGEGPTTGTSESGNVGGLAADSSGNAYIAGMTYAPDFPATTGAWQTQCDINEPVTFCDGDSYVAKLNPTGTALVWATYLGNGSNGSISILGPIILDSALDVYVLGQGSGELPIGGGILSPTVENTVAYVAELNPTGTKVLSGMIPNGADPSASGLGEQKPGGFAVDAKGAVYIAGYIGTGNTTATAGAFQQSYAGGGTDGFVTKMLPLDPSTTTLSLSSATVTAGQTVTFTATVSGPSGVKTVPTGTVTFLNGTGTLGSGTLGGSGTATYSTSLLNATTYTVTASYGGDSNFSGSVSSAKTLVVDPISTTTKLTTSAANANLGASLTLTATVTSSSGTPAGTVTFMNGSTTLGTGTLNGSGVATYITSSLAAGSYSLVADYGGNTTYAASTSSAVKQTVTAPAFTIGVSPSTVTVNQGSNGAATLTLSPVGGFSKQVSFNCSGLPTFATCAFSPSTITPNGNNGSVTTTVTVATDVSTASLHLPQAPFGTPIHIGSTPILAIAFLGLFGLAAQRRRIKRQYKGWGGTFFLVLAMLSAFGAVCVSGCGGGGTGSGGSGGGGGGNKTPVGSTTITVTATATGESQTASFNLDVQ